MTNALRRSARLIRLGIAAQFRNPALRLLGATGALGVAVYAWNQADVAGSLGVVLASLLGRTYGIGACLWFAYYAMRDQNETVGAVLRSKPVDGALWVLVGWATGMGTWLCLLGLAFLGAAAGALPHAGSTALLSAGWGFGRAAVAMGAMGTLSYALSRTFRSPLGGVLSMFAWFCAMGGVTYVPAFLQPDFAQNYALFITLAALLLAVCALLVERFRRGELRRPAGAALVILALGMLLAGGSARAYRARPPLDGFHVTAVWDQMAAQLHPRLGQRIPGFWLPDGKGGIVRTAAYPGKILLVFLFAADDLDAARTLPVLEAVQREYGGRGVQPLGVCMSPNHGDAAALARVGGYHFPIGNDLSTVHLGAPPDSAMTAAYNCDVLPLLVVTDRRRRARAILTDPYTDLDQLRQVVGERLAAEPE